MTHRERYCLWFICLLGLAARDAKAQLVHNTTNVYIGAGVELHVAGSVSNDGFVQNQGDVLLTGDWLNTHVYQGLGRLTLNGNTSQSLSNNANNIFSLRINGAGPIILKDNLVVSNRLELSQGIVRVSGSYSLSIANGATVAGGSSTSFVEGPLITNGTGYKFMPVGKKGNYYPVELLDVSGIDPVVQVEAFFNEPAFRLAGYGRIVSSVYWEQKTLSGTYSGSPVSVGYDLPDDVNDANLDLFQSPASSELFAPLGNTTASLSPTLDKVTTANPATGALILIGSRVNVAPGEAEFYFPTSFSPDAANPDNRSLRVFGEQLVDEDFLFVVYNRWGQQVFESRSLGDMATKGWSGQQNAGGTLTSGAYPYLLKGRRKNGEILEQKGLISIVR